MDRIGLYSTLDINLNYDFVENIKKNILYFDKIFFPYKLLKNFEALMDDIFLANGHLDVINHDKKMEFLIDKEIIYELSQSEIDQFRLLYENRIEKAYENALNVISKRYSKEKAILLTAFLIKSISVILVKQFMEEKFKNDSFTFIESSTVREMLKENWIGNTLIKLQKANQSEIKYFNNLVYVINKFPEINEDVSWKDIIQFKNDNETKEKLLRLRFWLSEISKKEYNPKEVAEIIEYNLIQYENHLKFCKLKYSYSKIEIAFVSVAEIIENLMKFKFSKIAKTIFDLNKQNFERYASESNAPGKELAYIYQVNKVFNNI